METEIIRILEIAEDEEKREKVHLELSKPPDFLLWSAVVLLNFLTATRPHSIGLHQNPENKANYHGPPRPHPQHRHCVFGLLASSSCCGLGLPWPGWWLLLLLLAAA
eukprot:SAG25_NODE_4821_length_745_cov_1.266254_1_plen_106_part_10